MPVPNHGIAALDIGLKPLKKYGHNALALLLFEMIRLLVDR